MKDTYEKELFENNLLIMVENIIKDDDSQILSGYEPEFLPEVLKKMDNNMKKMNTSSISRPRMISDFNVVSTNLENGRDYQIRASKRKFKIFKSPRNRKKNFNLDVDYNPCSETMNFPFPDQLNFSSLRDDRNESNHHPIGSRKIFDQGNYSSISTQESFYKNTNINEINNFTNSSTMSSIHPFYMKNLIWKFQNKISKQNIIHPNIKNSRTTLIEPELNQYNGNVNLTKNVSLVENKNILNEQKINFKRKNGFQTPSHEIYFSNNAMTNFFLIQNNKNRGSCGNNEQMNYSQKFFLMNKNANFTSKPFLLEIQNILTIKNKIDDYLYSILKGKFCAIVKTYIGSRIFSKYLKNTSSHINHKIFLEILENLNELLVHNMAIHFCQKIFGFLFHEDRILFLKKICPEMIKISYNRFGTYSIQSILDQVKSNEERTILIETFSSSFLYMCKDLYAAHVIERLISCFPENSIEFIYSLVEENFIMLSCDSNGLCVVKKVIMVCTDRKIIERIKFKLIENLLSLVIDHYGNYVIQCALDYWSESDCISILLKFVNNYMNLSTQKYSSNVVEKCLEKSSVFGLQKFVDEVVQFDNIAELMKNNYGNYVVQKALRLAQGLLKTILLETILKNIQNIGNQKLILKWNSILEKHIYDTNLIEIPLYSKNVNNDDYNSIYNTVKMMKEK